MSATRVLPILVFLACSFGSQPVAAQQPAAKPIIDPVVRKAADALGMVRWDDFTRGADRESLDLINRMEILATGTGHEVRRSGVWPEYAIKQLVLGVSLLTPAARMDVVRDVGGKESRTIQVVRGNLAWNESEPGIGSGPALPAATAAERMRQIYLLPHGFLRAVLKSPAADVTVSKDAAGSPVLGVRIDGALAQATLDKDYRPARIVLPVTDPLLGKATLQVELSGYKDFDGYEVFFPTHIVQKLNGRPLLDLNVTREMTGVYISYPVPANVKEASAATERGPSRAH